ncbi:MAG: putative holliday junction resolvase [Gallionellaceae bacterium]|nr:MAG: putative holliday junction resolvase [Gallionellaceae bacterium]
MPDCRGLMTEDRRQNAIRQPGFNTPPPAPSLLTGTFLAFDFGTKRIGVAVGNSISDTAQPLITLHGEQNDQRFASVAALIREWQPAALVVGLPSNDDGTPHEMTRLCRRFAQRLKGRFDLPVILVDERYTSAAASSQLNEAGIRGIKQKALLDQVAAQQILQAYFDEPSSGQAA